MSAFYLHKSCIFWKKNSTLTQSNSVSAVLKIYLVLFSVFSVFVRDKITVIENVSITDYASGIRLLECSKFAINQKNDNDVKICRHEVIVRLVYLFEVVYFILSSLVTGRSFMSI